MAPPTTIQFDDDVHPGSKSAAVDNEIELTRKVSREARSTDFDEGIVFSRTVSRGRSRSRGVSVDRRSTARSEEFNENEAGIRHAGDVRKKQTFRGTQLFFLAYQSIGVIYGDIGTSPLYCYSGIFSAAPPADDVLGACSLILWSLLIMVTLKYVIIILHADNEGEGGTFSAYSLLSRYANITHRDRREEPLIKMERHRTQDLHASNRQVRKTIEHSKFFKTLLKVIGVLAVSMVMSDGVLTPAQSVLGAYQGLDVLVPNISRSAVIGASCGTLVVLFMCQRFGTTKIGVCFAPIIIIWLGLLAGVGIYNIAVYQPSVFRAFNPGEAFGFLIRHKTDGWRALGGVLLSFTGVEALFADLGAFSMRAIQLSWCCYCLPCLLLTYLGQAAYIIHEPSAYAYPVFSTAPPGMLIPLMIFAVLAAIVASQAIITASFQLVAQIVKLSYFPQIQVIHTSTTHHNQLYVPVANWLLMIGTVIITAVFKNTNALGEAYGVCVMFVTFFDTQMVTLVALLVWRIRPWYVLLPYLAIACMDGAFLSSALTKVPDGAWFTILLACILASIFIEWRFGKEQQWSAEAKDRKPLSHYLRNVKNGDLQLKSHHGLTDGEVLSESQGFAIFFDKGGELTPIVFSQFISKLVVKHEVVVFFHMRPLETPSVPEEERYIVQKIDFMPNCFRVVARFGYMDAVITQDLAALIHSRIRNHLIKEHAHINIPIPAHGPADLIAEGNKTDDSSDGGEKAFTSATDAYPPAAMELRSSTDDESLPAELITLQRAFDHRTLFVIGKEEMHVAANTRLWRRLLLHVFIFMRENTRNKMANLKVPTDRLVEIGFVMDV